MDILGIIPARGGSRGIPNKNLAPLAGRPLLYYTCKAARDSKSLTRIIISTDDRAIARAGAKFGAEAPFMRPVAFSGNAAPMMSVILHALKWLADREDYHPGIVVLLQPTSPFRRGCHIDRVVNLLKKSGGDTVVSVVEVPHQYNPFSVMRLQNGRLVPDRKSGTQILRRQDKPKMYARNGPAVLALRTSSLLKNRDFYSGKCLPYVMSHEESIDIDTPLDLELASCMMLKTKHARVRI